MGKQLPQIIAWINSLPHPFSLLCFQEFPESQIKSFQKQLTGADYEVRFAVSFQRGTEIYGELTVFDKERIVVEKEETIELDTSFVEEHIFKLLLNRSALLTQLRYKDTSLVVVNTHLIAYSSNRHRREQLVKVMERVDVHTLNKTLPVLVLGDMNYSSLLMRGVLFDLVKKKGYANGFTAHTHAIFSMAKQQLDYIFYKNCEVKDIKVLQHRFSDHKPITFRIP